MKVGFIGLGQMGRPQALNLLKAGFELTAYDINRPALQSVVKAGATGAKSVKEVAQACRVVLTCLSTTEAMEEVVLGDRGILATAKKGDTLIDTGTTEPLLTLKIADLAKEKGIKVLDAPVAGGVPRAREGTLTIIVGGDKRVLQQNLNILNAIGKHVFHVGKSGSGQIVKLVNNCIGMSNIALFSEAMVLGVKAGIDAKALYDIIKTGSGNSWQFENKVPRILKRDFEPLARMEVAYKDFMLIMSLAKRLKVPMLVTSSAIQSFEMARTEGLEGEDMLAVIKVWEKLVGVEVKE